MNQQVKDFFTKLDRLDAYWQKMEWFNLKYDNPTLYDEALAACRKDSEDDGTEG